MRWGTEYLKGLVPLTALLFLASPAARGQLPPVATDDLFGLYATQSGIPRVLRFENVCPMDTSRIFFEDQPPIVEVGLAFDSYGTTFVLDRGDPQLGNRVLMLKDRNRDGDIDAGEGDYYYTDGHNPAPNMAAPVQMAMAPGGVILVSDTSATIWRLNDLDGDGYAFSLDELAVYYNASGVGPDPRNPYAMALYENGRVIYVSDTGTDSILRLEDLNGDGDAQDAGEAGVFYDDSGPGRGFVSLKALAFDFSGALYALDTYYTLDTWIDSVFVLQDLNGDKDALDAGEIRFFFASRGGGIDVWGLRGMAFNRQETLLMRDVYGSVIKVRDLNGDGDAMDPGESGLCFKDTDPQTIVTNQGLALQNVPMFSFVANNASNSVSVVDANAGWVLKTTPLSGTGPMGVADYRDRTRVAIANRANNTVSVIRTTDFAEEQNFPSHGTNPTDVAEGEPPEGIRIYVSNSGSNAVAVFNQSGAWQGSTPVGSIPQGINVSVDQQAVFVANRGSNTVTKLRASPPYDVLKTISSEGTAPVAVIQVATPAHGNRLYVVNNGSNRVTVFDANENYLGISIPVGSQPLDITDGQNGQYVYVTSRASSSVAKINTTGNSVRTIPLSLPWPDPSTLPLAVDITPQGDRGLVTNPAQHEVIKFEAVGERLVLPDISLLPEQSAAGIATVLDPQSVITLAGFWGEPEGEEDSAEESPSAQGFALGANYPNPFNPKTTIAFSIRDGRQGLGTIAQVSLRVYNVRGERVRTLAVGSYAPGIYQVAWDGTGDRGEPLGSGVYFCRLEAPGVVFTRKMILAE